MTLELDASQWWINRLRLQGFGVTVNMWSEDQDVAVVLWREGSPVASGTAQTSLAEALAAAYDAVQETP